MTGRQDPKLGVQRAVRTDGYDERKYPLKRKFEHPLVRLEAWQWSGREPEGYMRQTNQSFHMT